MKSWYEFGNLNDQGFIKLLEGISGAADLHNHGISLDVELSLTCTSIQVLQDGTSIAAIKKYNNLLMIDTPRLMLKFFEKDIPQESLPVIRSLVSKFDFDLKAIPPDEFWRGLSWDERQLLTTYFGGVADEFNDYLEWENHPRFKPGDVVKGRTIDSIGVDECPYSGELQSVYRFSYGDTELIRKTHITNIPEGSQIVLHDFSTVQVARSDFDPEKEVIRYWIASGVQTYVTDETVMGILRWGPSSISKTSKVVV